MASTPRRFSLLPIPRTRDVPITATRGPVAPGPDASLWLEPALGPLGRTVDGEALDCAGAGSLRVTAGRESGEDGALVDLGRRLPFGTVTNPSLSFSLDFSEAISVLTDWSTWTFGPSNSLITLRLTRCSSASWEHWVGVATCVLLLLLYVNSSYFYSSICWLSFLISDFYDSIMFPKFNQILIFSVDIIF